MRTSHTRRLVSSALGLIVLGCLWFYFAPVALGGSTTYVVTSGISMEPRFHTGDLAVVRSQSSYHVGEIVAYHNKMLGTIVLHRIVGRAGNRYLFKGDNNNFIDFEHPTASQLIGALWLHVPGAGATLQSIHSPALVGILVAVGMLFFTGAVFTRRLRRRRRQNRAGGNAERPPRRLPQLSGEPAGGILAVGLIALLPFVALALLAFTRPTTARLPFAVPYKQSGTLSYSADTSPGPAYPGGRAVTGEPLFTRLVNAVDVRWDYLFQSRSKHTITGKASLSATVAAASGWQATLPLGPTTYFHGDRALVTGTLELKSLLELVARVQSATAVNSGSYTLTVVPHVSVSGSVDDMPLSSTFSPKLQFSLNQLELQPVVSGASAVAGEQPLGDRSDGGQSAGAQASASPFAPSTSGSVTSRRDQSLFLSLKFARLSVAAARRIALGAIVILVYILLATLAYVRPRLRDESAAIRARYGRLIIPVARVWQLPGVAVIDVADIDALVRIAEHYDRSILYEASDEGEAFWVTDESGQFRYAVGASPWTMDGEVFEERPRELFVVPRDSTPAEEWTPYDTADAVTQDWRVSGEASDVGRTPAIAAFAPITGAEWTSDC